jgi:toxin ParE1/3/4
MVHRVRLTNEAEADLQSIFTWIAERASPSIARGYVNRIIGYVEGFDLFPERGAVRDEILKGLRVVGFERRVSIAFVVEEDEAVVPRILYAGQALNLPDEH